MQQIILALLFSIFLTVPVFAQWNDCPRGEVNCTGECANFVDTNSDGYCDHSQPEPTVAAVNLAEENQTVEAVGVADVSELITGEELKTKTVQEVATIYGIDINEFIASLEKELGGIKVNPNSSFQLMHDNFGLAPNRVKEIAEGLVNGDNVFKDQITSTETRPIRGGKNYYLFPIALVLTALYGISWYGVKLKKISLMTHRKIWNISLLVSSLGLSILSILLVLRTSLGLIINLPFNITFWHVELGIIFVCISIYHILWHLSYFKMALSPKSRLK